MSDQDNTPDNTTDNAPEDTANDQPAAQPASGEAPAKKAAARKTAAKKTAAKKTADAPARKAPARKTTRKATAAEAAAEEPTDAAGSAPDEQPGKPKKKAAARPRKQAASAAAPGADAEAPPGSDKPGAPMVLFQAPEKQAPEKTAPARRKRAAGAETAEGAAAASEGAESTDQSADEQKAPKRTQKRTQQKPAAGEEPAEQVAEPASDPAADPEAGGGDGGDEDGEAGARRRPRRRGGRRRRKPAGETGAENADDTDSGDAGDSAEAGGEGSGKPDRQPRQQDRKQDKQTDADEPGGEGGTKRRRTRNRAPKSPEDEIASVSGSTRLEAKKQRRREGREAGRRRAPIVSEAEFLARRESVDRVMVIRQRDDLTQIGVIEDKVLVEHYVSRESQTSLIGNVYLGRVQNVLPSMEAAFVDIGKGRNAVLYAGEVNWSGLGHKEGQPRKIESVLSSGQTILVQVTKDPIGHKGARLTGQISLPGRFLVYVPDGNTSGISRKLPDTERNRLKTLLKEIVPDTAGVIVRTAAEGASEDELTLDVERLTARWSDIEAKVKAGKGPELLYGEPDLTLKVVRDLFTEDFSKLVVQGADAWDLVESYVSHVAPDLKERLERFEPDGDDSTARDLFAAYRVDEQIAKGLDRKVWLPSGGSLIIDRTEAMTVVDVNTGKFTGSGGNLEETVTKNNLEAAEEIVRQLRLRDIGGIIVVDFIDMVLESNRDLVLRRLVECLGRDRTRHQVAEVTSLGLVQMTRKRIGTGLLEAFSEECTHCKGRGLVVHDHPIETAGSSAADDEPRGRRSRGGRSRSRTGNGETRQSPPPMPSPKDLAGTRPHPDANEPGTDEQPTPTISASEDDAVDAAADSGAADTRMADAPEVEPSTVEATDAVMVEETETPETAAPGTDGVQAGDTAEAGDTSEQQSEAPQPMVVTSTRRRRTASRPAGPPAAAEAAVQHPETAASSDGSSAEAVEAEEPEPLAVPDEAGEEPTLLHVPVKKKGARKR